MTIVIKKSYVALATGVVFALVAGAGLSSAAAAPAPVGGATGSAQPVYILDANDGSRVPTGTELEFDYVTVASPSPDDFEPRYIGSSDATSVYTFISPRGSERDISAWTASAPNALEAGTFNTWLPTVSPGNQSDGNQAGLRANGGDFSIGVAFVKNNGLTLADAGVSFQYIHIATDGSAKWTFEVPGEGTGPVEPTDPTLTGDIDLEATTVAPVVVDGALSLTVPADAKVVFDAATLVDNVSTSTGVLPAVTVTDARALTHAGWNLTTTVSDFVSGANVIEAKQLGIAPTVSSTATGVTAASAQVAGSAVYPAELASATDAAQVGDTTLNAALTFVAPADKPAGTYTSKMTLTLVSK